MVSKRSRQSLETFPNKIKKKLSETIMSHAAMLPTPALAVNGKVNCLSAIFFHPVRHEEDFHTPRYCFAPLFVHHFFGLKEEIHGFSQLCIKIFYTVDTFEVYIKVEGIRTGLNSNGLSTPSDTFSSISSNPLDVPEVSVTEENIISSRILSYFARLSYPGDFHRTEESFLEAVNSVKRFKFKPFGKPKCEIASSENTKIVLHENVFDAQTLQGKEFKIYHRRVEWFLHFFIDACSNIDQDRKWTVILPFIHPSTEGGPQSNSSKDSSPNLTKVARSSNHNSKLDDTQKVKNINYGWSGYELAGIVTLYHFFALPRSRTRVSQFMVFPHLQGKSIGLNLLEWVFENAYLDQDVGEITVEDPASSFAQLRDIVGVRQSLKRGVIKPKDLFPESFDIQHYKETTDAATNGIQETITNENFTNAVVRGKSKKVKMAVHDSAPVATFDYFSDSSFRKKLKDALKESPNQITRILEILSVAKLLPHPLPPPPLIEDSEKSSKLNLTGRDWRMMSNLKDAKLFGAFHESDQIKDIRIRIKKRIRLDKLDELVSLPPAEQRTILTKTWQEIYLSYYRTINKIRTSLLSDSPSS